MQQFGLRLIRALQKERNTVEEMKQRPADRHGDPECSSHTTCGSHQGTRWDWWQNILHSVRAGAWDRHPGKGRWESMMEKMSLFVEFNCPEEKHDLF